MRIRYLLYTLLMVSLFMAPGCDDDYFNTGEGTHQEFVNMSTMDFLRSKPKEFSQFVTLIEKSGLDEVLTSETDTFTLFAVRNYSIETYLKRKGIKMEDITSEEAHNIVAKYFTKGAYLAKDILSRKESGDLEKEGKTDGVILFEDYYLMYDGYKMRIRSLQNYEGDIPFGARTVQIVDEKDTEKDYRDDVANTVTTHNIKTRTGVVHVLETNHVLDFTKFTLF